MNIGKLYLGWICGIVLDFSCRDYYLISALFGNAHTGVWFDGYDVGHIK